MSGDSLTKCILRGGFSIWGDECLNVGVKIPTSIYSFPLILMFFGVIYYDRHSILLFRESETFHDMIYDKGLVL